MSDWKISQWLSARLGVSRVSAVNTGKHMLAFYWQVVINVPQKPRWSEYPYGFIGPEWFKFKQLLINPTWSLQEQQLSWRKWKWYAITWLTHWGQVTHNCISKLTAIGSDNGLPPGRRQAIIWTNDGIFLIGILGTNFSEILIEIYTFSFKKKHFKMSSVKGWPFCIGLNVLRSSQGLLLS